MPEPMGGGVFRSQPITSVPAKRNGASKPFWRWPIDGVDGEEGGGLMMSSGLESSEITDPTLRFVVQSNNEICNLLVETADYFKAQILELRTENSQLRSTLAEMKAKLSELDFIVERLKVENKGPPGAKGERGRDGRRRSPRGTRGKRRRRQARRGVAHHLLDHSFGHL